MNISQLIEQLDNGYHVTAQDALNKVAKLEQYTKQIARIRLEYLRGEIEAECISYSELFELQSLAKYIEPGDVQLLEWAGVPEGTK